MKITNKIFTCFLLLAFGVISCKKDDIGGTATQNVAGEWAVSADAILADGSLFEEDWFGDFYLTTFNTSSNSSDKMWITDNGSTIKFKGVTSVDVNKLEFAGDKIANTSISGDTFTITNGKVLKGAAKTPSGMPADSIVLEIKFSKDKDAADYGYDRYRISGYRKTGLVSDDH